MGNLIRYSRFTVRRDKGCLRIHGGLLTRRAYTVSLEGICYLDIRQTVFTSLTRLYAVFIHAIGYGKHKGDVSILMPACTRKTLEQGISLLLPEWAPSPRQLKPNWGAVFRFLVAPFWPCTLIPLTAFLLCHLYPSWREVLAFLGWMASLPAYWFLAVRLLDFFSSGVSRQGNCFTLRYSKGYYLHTVVISQEKIASVTIEQNPFQFRDDRCDLILSTYGESPKRHRCKNLDRKQLLALFDLEEVGIKAPRRKKGGNL